MIQDKPTTGTCGSSLALALAFSLKLHDGITYGHKRHPVIKTVKSRGSWSVKLYLVRMNRATPTLTKPEKKLRLSSHFTNTHSERKKKTKSKLGFSFELVL